MADAIPEPANTSPDVDDWQALLAKQTKITGGMALARLTNFENTSEPKVAEGSRFEISEAQGTDQIRDTPRKEPLRMKIGFQTSTRPLPCSRGST